MKKSKIVLEKIEIKKIKTRSDNKLNILEKESRKFKSKLSTRGKVFEELNQINIDSETKQNVAKIYQKSKTMADDRNLQTDDDEDLKISEISELSTILSDSEKDCDSNDFPYDLNRTESSSRPTINSISSFTSQSSFGFFESESSVQEYKYNKLKEVSNASLKELDAESEKKILSDNSNGRFSKEPVRTRFASQNSNLVIPRHAYDKMTVRNSMEEKSPFAGSRHFCDDDVKIDRRNSLQKKCSTSSLGKEQDQIKELRDALEKSTNCLVRCLEIFHNKTQKQERLNLREVHSTTKSNRNASECEDGEKGFKTLDRKKVVNKSDSLLSTSREPDLENNSVTGVKQRINMEACLTRTDSPKSIYTEATKQKNWPCGCYNGRCLHSQSTGRNLNGDLAQVEKMPKKKIAPSASKGDFLNNQMPSNPIQKFRSTSKHSKRYHLPLPDVPISDRTITGSGENENASFILAGRSNDVNEHPFESWLTSLEISHNIPISARKVTDLIENENASFGLVDRSNAGDNHPLENWLTLPEKLNLVKKEKSEEYCPKREKESKLDEISHKNEQLGKREEDEKVFEDNCEPNTILLLTFIFVVTVFICFLLSMFIFI